MGGLLNGNITQDILILVGFLSFCCTVFKRTRFNCFIGIRLFGNRFGAWPTPKRHAMRFSSTSFGRFCHHVPPQIGLEEVKKKGGQYWFEFPEMRRLEVFYVDRNVTKIH